MKIQHLFATTISLALVACQVTAPVNTPVINKATNQAVYPLTIAKPDLPATETIATVTQTGDKEQVKVQIKLPKVSQRGFRTQMANRDQLAYIKVSLKGQGISGILTHDGAEFLAVNGDTITATISELPLKNGDLRMVMVQGYDSNFQPLGSYEARGYYRSQTGVKTISITLRRSMILLGRILEQALISNATLLAVLDVDALQAIFEEAMGFNADTGEFNLDPSQFDADEILALIPSGGSPLPTAGELQTNARQTEQDVLVTVNTPNGGLTNETVRLVLNDPASGAKVYPGRTASGFVASFANVVVGNWTLSAYDADGNLLNSTPVSVSEFGVTVTDNPFMLTGVREFVGEFLVNTYTTLQQSESSIAMDDDGDFVVTWQSNNQDGSSYGIFAQRYNSVGTAQGSEFQVNTYTLNAQREPSIAMDSDGDFVVTWRSSDQDGSGYGVYAKRYNSMGIAQDSEFQVNTYTTMSQYKPAIAMDNDGDFVVAWQGNGLDGDSMGIYAKRFNSNGVDQGSEFLVNTYTANPQTFVDIAMDSDGDFVLAWHSTSQDGSEYGVYAQRYSSMGVKLGSEFRVNTYTTSSQSVPSIAMDSDGDFVVTWQSSEQDQSNNGIYAKRYTSAGTAQGSEFLVNTYTINGQNQADIGMDNDGNFVIDWSTFDQDGSSYGIYAQLFNADGQAQ